MDRIYLDYNATTPCDAAVAAAITECLNGELLSNYGNPSSGHFAGNAAAETILDARAQLAKLMNAPSSNCVLFESCATESITHIITSLLQRVSDVGGRHIVSCRTEHIAVLEALKYCERQLHATVKLLLPNSDGRITAEALTAAIQPDTFLVTIMHANNETGAVNDCAAISKALRDHRKGAGTPILLHADCSQSLGKIPVDVQSLGLDLATFAGHKLYAPKGIGATYVRPGLLLPRLLHGAGQEGGGRAGTENVPYIAGLGKAAELCSQHGNASANAMCELRDRLAYRLKAGAAREGLCVTVNGPLKPWFDAMDISDPMLAPGSSAATAGGYDASGQGWTCLPNTLSISFPGSFSAPVLHALRDSVAASAGAACHSAQPTDAEHAAVSHVLAAMSVPHDVALATLRLSVGRWTTQQEIDRAAELILKAVKDDVKKRRVNAHAPIVPPEPANGLHTECQFHQHTYTFSVAGARVLAVANLVKDTGAVLLAAAPEYAGRPGLEPSAVIGPALPLTSSAGATHALVLDVTVAHPQGGGQPSDVGLIAIPHGPSRKPALFQVVQVRWGSAPNERAVVHYGRFIQVTQAIEGMFKSEKENVINTQLEAEAERVTGLMAELDMDAPARIAATLSELTESLHLRHCHVAISSSYRAQCARLHSAGHMLDQAVRRVYPTLFPGANAPPPSLKPGKGYHFPDGPWVEYDGAVPDAVREAFVSGVNDEIARLVALNVSTVVLTLTKADSAELLALGIDAGTDLAHLSPAAPVRIVCIGGKENACPCGGTHVTGTALLTGTRVTKIKVQKGKTKVSYIVD